MTSDHLTLAGDGSPLPAPLYFQAAETVTVIEVEECLATCQARTDGSCQAFYLETDTITCHVGTFMTQDSGQGVLVTEALQMFSSFKNTIGLLAFFRSCPPPYTHIRVRLVR